MGPIGPQGVPGGMNSYQIASAVNAGTFTSGARLSARAVCPAGMRVLGGGVAQTPPAGFAVSLVQVSSFPDTNASWFAEFRNNQSVSLPSITITVYAICAN
jgi:hypothetical protein